MLIKAIRGISAKFVGELACPEAELVEVPDTLGANLVKLGLAVCMDPPKPEPVKAPDPAKEATEALAEYKTRVTSDPEPEAVSDPDAPKGRPRKKTKKP